MCATTARPSKIVGIFVVLTYPSNVWMCKIFYFKFGVILGVRHSFTTRMLLTCIRSKLYWNEQTTDDLFAEIARQARELFVDGLQVP